MANVAYVRVSTVEQNEARQVEELKQKNIDKWFMEKVSGKNTERSQFKAMMDYVREGDTIFIHDFSRISRSTKDLLETLETLKERNVHLVSNKENLDTSTPTGKLLVTMIAAINEFERTNMLERQREGIAIAKENGVYKGRKPIEVKDFGEHYKRYMKREISKPALAKELGISRVTLDKLFKEYEQANK